jgi:hypothetical protein
MLNLLEELPAPSSRYNQSRWIDLKQAPHALGSRGCDCSLSIAIMVYRFRLARQVRAEQPGESEYGARRFPYDLKLRGRQQVRFGTTTYLDLNGKGRKGEAYPVAQNR